MFISNIIKIFLLTYFIFNISFAHPHNWLTSDIKFIKNNGKLTNIKYIFHIDNFNSELLFSEIDFNKNKKLDENELNKAIENSERDFSIVKNFFYIKNKQNKIPYKLHDIKIEYKNNIFLYTYDLKLTKPLNSIENIEISIFDPEYYTEFDFVKNINLLNDYKNCNHNISINENIKIYNGLVSPKTIKITCK